MLQFEFAFVNLTFENSKYFFQLTTIFWDGSRFEINLRFKSLNERNKIDAPIIVFLTNAKLLVLNHGFNKIIRSAWTINDYIDIIIRKRKFVSRIVLTNLV